MPSARILLVEDQKEEATLVCEALAGVGRVIDVSVVDSLAAARAWLAARLQTGCGLPDLVITDHHLPDGNGQELIHDLKHHAGTAHLPMVMVSGDVLRPSELGSIAWFGKPDTWDEWRWLALELVSRLPPVVPGNESTRGEQESRTPQDHLNTHRQNAK
jgi:CheY-like chemotaxis protein